jgi:ABC-type phosphate/phosphonate transport system substrate-binding protein
MSLIAALPMYDWPECRADTDRKWRHMRRLLESVGIDCPETLVRRNADMPAVPGGIRDAEGRLIAPDPATLSPDELDLHTLWRHPDLLIAQACWGPIELGLGDHVHVVGQPSYQGIEGGEGLLYSSAVLMRVGLADGEDDQQDRRILDRPPPPDGRADLPVAMLRGRRLAYNAPDSMSGLIALQRDIGAAGESFEDIFPTRLETGGHRASILAVAKGGADVCAVDCLSWDMARRHEPMADRLQVVGWTSLRMGLPLITSRRRAPEVVHRLLSILGPDCGSKHA